MKKSLITLLLVLTFASYIVYYRLFAASDNVSDLTGEATIPAQPASQTPAVIPPVKAGQSASGQSAYKDGQYTGDPGQGFYGITQVKAVISGGKLAAVEILRRPQDQQHSDEVGRYAVPLLQQEAIAAQSAEIDIVSGATDISGAFKSSLASALAQAKS